MIRPNFSVKWNPHRLKYGEEYDDETPCSASTRAGTKVSIALGAFRGEQHCVIFNLEPVVWSLLWMGHHRQGIEQGLNRHKLSGGSSKVKPPGIHGGIQNSPLPSEWTISTTSSQMTDHHH